MATGIARLRPTYKASMANQQSAANLAGNNIQLPPPPCGIPHQPAWYVKQRPPPITGQSHQLNGPTITLDSDGINNLLSRAVESTLKGWKNSNIGFPPTTQQSLPSTSGKSTKLLNGTGLFHAKGFSGLTIQEEVSDMLRILDSNEHETMKFQLLKKQLQLLQKQNQFMSFTL